MDEFFLFTQGDVELLRSLIAREAQRKQNDTRRLPPEVEDYASIMQVVLTPADGIPGCLEPPPGTGTGTPHGNAGDRPGKASCEVYAKQLINYLGTDYEEEKPTGRSIDVYNLNYTAVDGLQFVTALLGRDGFWYVPAQGLRFKAC